MLFYAITGLINGLVSTLTGGFVYFKGRKAVVNKTFFRFCLAVAFWSYGYFIWQISLTAEQALFWSRVLMMGSIFIPVTFFHFIVIFLDLFREKKKIIITGYFFSALCALSNFTPLFVNRVEPALLFPFWPKPGPVFHLFHLMFVIYVIYSWYLLYREQQKIKGIKKLQIRYVLLGSFIGFVGGATNHFLWYNIPIPPYGNLFPVIGFLLYTFAILKYHLFEIRVILTELLVGVMGIILVILPFVMPASSLRILTVTIFILFCIFGYYLIKATHEEAKRREEAEKMAIQERALRQKSEKLAKEFERLDRAKTQFLLATQHHLRTPLSIVKGYISMILEGSYGKVEEKTKKALSGIQESIERLIKLVNEFLDISQLQVGREILKKEEVQVEELIGEIVEELEPMVKEKGIYLRFEKPKEIPGIKMDKVKMKTAIFNVIDNGIKYTERGGVTVKLKIENLKLKIIVEDTGIGLTKEEIKTLFTEFFERGRRAEKIYTTGRGIGLYIAKNIIEAHRGRIWVESEGKDKGSTFYIELPFK